MRRATLTSEPETEAGTFGEIATDSGLKLQTLERRGEGDHPRIPAGVYHVRWTVGEHPKHPEVYEIMNVPGRTAILIHCANVYLELEGCVAVGKARATFPAGSLAILSMDLPGITRSGEALAALIADMGKEDFELTVVRK